MKSGITPATWKLFLAVLLMSFADSTHAQTYTSRTAGDWDNITNVWSTDGGAIACACAPPFILAGEDVVINHPIALTGDLFVDATSSVDIGLRGH